jgi:mitochondrial chaperone BCS1
MDMNSFLRGMLPTASANMTQAAANATRHGHMQPNMIDSLLPLLGLRGLVPMYGLLGSWLGLDPTFLLTFFGIFWAGSRLFRQVHTIAAHFVAAHCMSTIHISSTDDIYNHIMKWLALQPRMINSRSLTAETESKTAWEDEDASNVSRDVSGVYLNFANQEAKAAPRYVPAIGLHSFWWKGTYYRLHRKQESVFDDGTSGGLAAFKDKEDLVLSCFGRSPAPLKALIKHTKEQFYRDHRARTIVKRPTPPGTRRFGRHAWLQVADRPVRDMKTVVLDSHQKMQLLADVNEYLHPGTPRWYANRGIPLRRGYLFHGPPGTGKTSLSFALAGVFGLDIYVISLLEPSLTEEDLGALFNVLPRRCVVLLEDIDTAGLRRPVEELVQAETRSSNRAEARGTSNDWKVSDLAKALKSEKNNDEKKGISLSGLLNAIDGVASHEGRVLIMTTNVPESLDEALIRPGRVDLQVKFTNATRGQAQELFIRMYEADQGRRQHVTNGQAKTNVVANGKLGKEATGQPILDPEAQDAMQTGDLDISVDDLPEFAKQFADKILDGRFSPAEIQGYLLKRKKHPRKAVDDADKWVEALVQQKDSKSKILQVQ